jgi:hypothetical protein
MSMNINSSTQSFLNEAKNAFQNDGRLDKKEFESLKNTISSSKLPENVKSEAIKFLEQAKDSSDGFLGIFGKDISNKELSQLKELASSLGNNSIAKKLFQSLESSIAKPPSDVNTTTNHKSHGSEPSNSKISNLFSRDKNSTSEVSDKNHIETNSKSSGEVVGHPKATGYYPYNNKMEGGFKDKIGKPLHTLQDFLDGSAPYVSIAIDKKLYNNGTVKYGDNFRIPEMEAKYGKKIIFKAVDTGGAFTDKGFSRIDICTDNQKCSLDKLVNSKLTLIKD